MQDDSAGRDRNLSAEFPVLRVGTRGSRLALHQTNLIVGLLQDKLPDVKLVVQAIQTTADRLHDLPIAELGDKGVFVRAIEAALLDGVVDLAVHSLKDVPAETGESKLTLAAFSVRGDPRDVLVAMGGARLTDLSPASRIGTSSPRRAMQLRILRPDVDIVAARGNVDTRLQKLFAGEYDALILTAAGLERLDLSAHITQYFAPDEMVPDAGQGIIVVQARAGRLADLLSAIDDQESHVAALAERAVVRALGAGCRSPVGAHAIVQGEEVRVLAVASKDVGSRVERAHEVGSRRSAEEVGRKLGERLRAGLEGGP